MVKIEELMQEGKLSRINELELDRYLNFLHNSYKDNLEHSKHNCESFPRWAIISGYYSMHDSTKLFIAKKFRFKISLEVHATTIKVLREVLKSKEILNLFEKGYNEFLSLANYLSEAKKERVKSQYYTGSNFSKEEFRKRSREFLDNVVEPYLLKISRLSGEE